MEHCTNNYVHPTDKTTHIPKGQWLNQMRLNHCPSYMLNLPHVSVLQAHCRSNKSGMSQTETDLLDRLLINDAHILAQCKINEEMCNAKWTKLNCYIMNLTRHWNHYVSGPLNTATLKILKLKLLHSHKRSSCPMMCWAAWWTIIWSKHTKMDFCVGSGQGSPIFQKWVLRGHPLLKEWLHGCRNPDYHHLSVW